MGNPGQMQRTSCSCEAMWTTQFFRGRGNAHVVPEVADQLHIVWPPFGPIITAPTFGGGSVGQCMQQFKAANSVATLPVEIKLAEGNRFEIGDGLGRKCFW